MTSVGGLMRYMTTSLSGGVLLFGAFSSSTNYQLQSYGINGAASNSASSTTYHLESSTGQLESVPTSGTTYTTQSGSIQAQQASVPPAPTLSNGSGTYYNKLGLIINTGSNASDATYVVAVSTNNFTTTNYVQADGSLNTTPLFQTYAQWGSSTGTNIIGLSGGTAYEVKVSAMQGTFTQSAYGPYASSTTASPSITFSLSPNSLSLPSLVAASTVTSSTITGSLATNATFGGSIYVSDSNGGLKSTSRSTTIASASGNLAALAHGYGLLGSAATQTSGGPLSIVSPYNGTGSNVGLLSTTPQAVFTTSAPVVGGSGTAVLLAKASATDPAAPDYGDVVTFIAAASF